MISERFGGEVPRTLEQLVQVPGVGRKTAAVVLGNAFGRHQGIAVDTHVGRSFAGSVSPTRPTRSRSSGC